MAQWECLQDHLGLWGFQGQLESQAQLVSQGQLVDLLDQSVMAQCWLPQFQNFNDKRRRILLQHH